MHKREIIVTSINDIQPEVSTPSLCGAQAGSTYPNRIEIKYGSVARRVLHFQIRQYCSTASRVLRIVYTRVYNI